MHLHLWGNQIEDAGARATASALCRLHPTKKPKIIDIGYVTIKLDAALDLANAIQCAPVDVIVEMGWRVALLENARKWRRVRVGVLAFLALASRHATAIAAFARRDGDRAVMRKVLKWLLG